MDEILNNAWNFTSCFTHFSHIVFLLSFFVFLEKKIEIWYSITIKFNHEACSRPVRNFIYICIITELSVWSIKCGIRIVEGANWNGNRVSYWTWFRKNFWPFELKLPTSLSIDLFHVNTAQKINRCGRSAYIHSLQKIGYIFFFFFSPKKRKETFNLNDIRGFQISDRPRLITKRGRGNKGWTSRQMPLQPWEIFIVLHHNVSTRMV